MTGAPLPEWTACPGFYPYYIVSSDGRIRNIDTGRILFGEIGRDGYRRVNLSLHGKKYKRRVHRLVCEAFHGPCPPGRECAHLDGSRTNNRASNLAWLTPSENNQQKVQHGTRQAGENAAHVRLTVQQVSALRQAASEGTSERKLAERYGISPSHAHRIIAGEAWNG